MRRTITAFIALAAALAGSAAAADEPRHLKDALTAQKRLVRVRPDHAGAFNDLGNLHHLDGELTLAAEAYRRAIELDPSFTPALYNLALLLQQTGEKKAAKRTLESVLELEPDHEWGHFQMGRILENSYKYNKAAHHYARAFVLDPGLMEIGRNPQILDTRVATRARAKLMAYTERMEKLEAAPRQYHQPDRITRLLVPEVRGARQEERKELDPEKAARAEERRQQRREKRQQEQSSDNQGGDGASPGL